MRYREDDFNLFARIGVEPHRVVFNSAKLATIVRTFKYCLAYLRPILRVSCAIFGLDWHISNARNIVLLYHQVTHAFLVL